MEHGRVAQGDAVDPHAGAVRQLDHIRPVRHGLVRPKGRPPGIALAVNRSFAADFEVMRATGGYAVLVSPLGGRIIRQVIADEDGCVFDEVQIDAAGERERPGQKFSRRNQDGSAAGGCGVNRLLDGAGVHRFAIADRAVVGDVEGRMGNGRQRNALRRNPQGAGKNKAGNHRSDTVWEPVRENIHFVMVTAQMGEARFQPGSPRA